MSADITNFAYQAGLALHPRTTSPSLDTAFEAATSTTIETTEATSNKATKRKATDLGEDQTGVNTVVSSKAGEPVGQSSLFSFALGPHARLGHTSGNQRQATANATALFDWKRQFKE